MPPNQGILDGNSNGHSNSDWDAVKQEEWHGDADGMSPTSPHPLQQGRALIGRLGSLILRRGRSSSPSGSAPGELKRTAYLDGVRGFAAFLVYWQHHTAWAHEEGLLKAFERSFGTDGNFYLATLPFVRLAFTGGHLAVSTFFVISGYVLTAKPLALIQAADHARLSENLASALFRRWLRLFMPLIVTTFSFMTFWYLSGSWVFGMEHEKSYLSELWRWYTEGKNFTFVFNMGGDPYFRYNPHLWSIPVEFRGSVLVYTTVLALSRCARDARLLCQAALIFYFIYIADGWYCAMFISGMLQCDLDLLSARGELPAVLARFSGVGPIKKLVMWHLLVAALYLGGTPAHDAKVETLAENRGWYYLSLLKPQAVFDYKWYYLLFASTLVVALVPRLPPLKRFFETRFCQYLGRVSYGLYLAHGPVLWLVGDRIYAAVGWHSDDQRQNIPGWVDRFPLPKLGPLGLEVSFLLPHLIILPLTLWAADMITRFVDEPSVRFAQWLYAKTLPPKPVKAAGVA
ncbi:hypothetical protein RB597_001562 [Gaeumannomyces tritici]